MGVLPGNAGQIFGNGIEQLDRSDTAVDVHSVGVVAGDNSSDQQTFGSLISVCAHNFGNLAGTGNFKKSFQLGAFSTRAHQIGRGAAAQQKVYRIKNDRFAGTGFPAEDCQTLGKTDLQIIDNGKISNGKFF